MNLYLYIPPSSAHPPSCFKGLIARELHRYWLQNNPVDFQNILINFITCLLARGHKLEYIAPIFINAAVLFDKNPTSSTNSTTSEDDTLFIHRVYHPNGINRSDIRHLYDKILKAYLDVDKMIVAMSRPTNLRDVLTKATLTLPANLSIQNLIQDCTTH